MLSGWMAPFVHRSKALAELRIKEGRTLSRANRSRLGSLAESMQSALGDIQKLLEETDPEKEAELEKALALIDNAIVDAELTLAQLDGHL